MPDMREWLAATWGLAGALMATLAAVEWDAQNMIANVLRLAIVVLMVITAFLLIRYDSRPR